VLLRLQLWRRQVTILAIAYGCTAAYAAPRVDDLLISPRLGQPFSGRLVFKGSVKPQALKIRMASVAEYESLGLKKPEFMDSVAVYKDAEKPNMPVLSGSDQVTDRNFDVLVATSDDTGLAFTNFSVKAHADGHFELVRQVFQDKSRVSSAESSVASSQTPIAAGRLESDRDSMRQMVFEAVQESLSRKASLDQNGTSREPRATVSPKQKTAQSRDKLIAELPVNRVPVEGAVKPFRPDYTNPAYVPREIFELNDTARRPAVVSDSSSDQITINKLNLLLVLILLSFSLLPLYIFWSKRGASAQRHGSGVMQTTIDAPSVHLRNGNGGGSEDRSPRRNALEPSERSLGQFGPSLGTDPEAAIALAAAHHSYAATTARIKEQYYRSLAQEASLGRDALSPVKHAYTTHAHEPAGLARASTPEPYKDDARGEEPSLHMPRDEASTTPPTSRPQPQSQAPVQPQQRRSVRPQVPVPGVQQEFRDQARNDPAAATNRLEQGKKEPVSPIMRPSAIKAAVTPTEPGVAHSPARPIQQLPVKPAAVSDSPQSLDGPERQKVELASVYMSMGDQPTARILLREVLSAPETPWHKKAQELLNEINQLEK
jgi:FimV-like protein